MVIIRDFGIERLNIFLNPTKNPNVTTAMWNEPIKPKGKETKYFRTLVCFNYDKHASAQKCFAYSSPKFGKKPNDLLFYILPNEQRINLNAPIFIPTTYLEILNHEKEIKTIKDQDIKNWLIENKKDLELTIKYHQEILYQYRCIKYNSDYKNKFYFLNVKKAHEKMIDEVKTEKFCNLELEKINNKNCC